MPAPARRMAIERFQGHGPLVDPAAFGGGFDHAELARDVVGRQRHAGKMVADAAEDVEIGQRRLDHDDVGPFGQIELDFAQRLARRRPPGPSDSCGGRRIAARFRPPRETGRRRRWRTWPRSS